jgi:Tfp pilus assembly protein PilX
MNARRQQGASILIVLILLTVMALGALSIARVSDTSTAVAGNLSFKAAAMQASEVGLSEGFAQLQALTAAELEATKGAWYFPVRQAVDAAGLPSTVDWATAPKVAVGGGYSASYVVERMCTGAVPVTDPAVQCFLKRLPAQGSAKAGLEKMDAPAVVQYRMTVYVQGPKGTQTFVQAMATRSS